MNIEGCVNQASNDLHIGFHPIFFTLTCGDNNCILLFQEIDYGNNTKTNDADINNFLYSDDGPSGSGYNLPEDMNEPNQYMQQPNNAGMTAST